MKKIISTFAICLLAAAVSAGTYVQIITPSTNLSYSVGAGNNTNTAGTLTNNVFPGVVLGATTNFYSDYGTMNTQSATNLYPSAGWNPGGGYPNTLYGPNRAVVFYINGSLLATNATSTACVVRFAGSVDGNLWVSNIFTLPYTVAVNTTSPGPLLFTNTIYPPFVCVQQVENPGASVLTNLTVEASTTPGF
jgi:hypothetical protein